MIVLLSSLTPVGHGKAAEKQPVLLYSRYFNAEGENRKAPLRVDVQA